MGASGTARRGRRKEALATLLAEVRACRICAEHLPEPPRPILQLGRGARLLIAGQAPGRRAHESGVPFQDASGERLRAWLGISTAQFHDASRVAVLPMGFCYPGSGRAGDLPPRPECAAAWRARLLAALPDLELTLALGRHAQAEHLAGRERDTLTATVHAWRDYWPRVVPLPHPSPRNNPWLRRNPWFEREVLPALRRRVAELLAAPA